MWVSGVGSAADGVPVATEPTGTNPILFASIDGNEKDGRRVDNSEYFSYVMVKYGTRTTS